MIKCQHQCNMSSEPLGMPLYKITSSSITYMCFKVNLTSSLPRVGELSRQLTQHVYMSALH